MNIYKIWVDKPLGWGTYDSAIVVASNEEVARHIHPGSSSEWGPVMGWNSETCHYDKPWYESDEPLDSWAMPERVNVRLVGTTEIFHEGTVLCASYNAG